MHKLFTAPGSGGMIVEAAFALAEIPVEIEIVDWEDLGWGSDTLGEYNPLGQIPTLLLPDGRVMTESAAMVMHLADLNPKSGLVPGADHPAREEFLHWLVFLVSAVYPTFTYGDVPERWVDGNENAARLLRAGTDEHRKTLYRHMEGFAGKPWFLGDTFSCIDLYLWIMRHWRPGTAWFNEECPRLGEAGLRAVDLAPVGRIQRKYFPE